VRLWQIVTRVCFESVCRARMSRFANPTRSARWISGDLPPAVLGIESRPLPKGSSEGVLSQGDHFVADLRDLARGTKKGQARMAGSEISAGRVHELNTTCSCPPWNGFPPSYRRGEQRGFRKTIADALRILDRCLPAHKQWDVQDVKASGSGNSFIHLFLRQLQED
jgi:hypothetical protein